ncbi:hypothetical protein JCM16138_06870 [Thermococcus atlanticus]
MYVVAYANHSEHSPFGFSDVVGYAPDSVRKHRVGVQIHHDTKLMEGFKNHESG